MLFLRNEEAKVSLASRDEELTHSLLEGLFKVAKGGDEEEKKEEGKKEEVIFFFHFILFFLFVCLFCG